MGELIVVGLGPGDASLLTVEARDVIAGALRDGKGLKDTSVGSGLGSAIPGKSC